MNTRGWAAVAAVLATAIAAAAPGAAEASERRAQGETSPGAQVLEVEARGHDGTVLRGWVHLPDRAPGERVPVVLATSPFYGQVFAFDALSGGPVVQETGDAGNPLLPPVSAFVENGYALALFNVRGSGNSAGCFDFLGRREERDTVELVEWAAEQPWSDGRVGMMGLSYEATTAFEAAVNAPPALRAVVAAAGVTDLATLNATPQGAAHPALAPYQAAYVTGASLAPPLGGGVEHATAEHAGVAPERLCPELRALYASPAGDAAGARDADFYAERRRIHRFGAIRAPILVTHGFVDETRFQNEHVWAALPDSLPKRMVLPQIGHEWPQAVVEREWLAWFDRYLKGDGAAPPPRRAEFEVAGDGGWRSASAWPPPTAQETALDLDAGSFRASPTAFEHMEVGGGPALPSPLLCPDAAGRRHVTTSAPLASDIVLAGNPYARLELTSDQPGGLVGVRVWEVGPDFACEAGATPTGHFRPLTQGAADLRLHRDGMTDRPFPTGEPTVVRVDLWSLAERVPAGHRIVVAVGHPGDRWSTRPFAPRLELDAPGSQVVLPLLDGSLPGARPGLPVPAPPGAGAHG